MKANQEKQKQQKEAAQENGADPVDVLGEHEDDDVIF